MIIREAKFVISNTDISKCPDPNKPEYAFIGRSNVGKSSLINMLCDHKKLAKISAKPGKTRLINHFLINGEWYLVDLPGYGYAKTSKSERGKWEKFIHKYLKYRTNLRGVFVLIDSRIEAQKNDLDFMYWLGINQVPFVIAFTKVDKLSRTEKEIFQAKYTEKLLESWEDAPLMFQSSAETGEGREDILSFIEEVNKSE